jgi:hypothetical protein
MTPKPFSISSDVNQGDPLSVLWQYLILNSVIKKLNLKGDISLKLRQIVAYADDVALQNNTVYSSTQFMHPRLSEDLFLVTNIYSTFGQLSVTKFWLCSYI